MTQFTVQAWNLWWGGTKVNDALTKQSQILQANPADIVLFQESFREHSENLSAELGLNHAQQHADCVVASKHEIELISTGTAPYATAAWVTIEDTKILVWSVHLSHIDYGPYSALEGAPQEAVNGTGGELTRVMEMRNILAETERIAPEGPVIIAGDFNSPASSDWAQREDRPDYVWPSVDVLVEAGYTDAFREIYPDANAVTADTWSQIEPLESEPRDRIDFIFTKGLVTVGATHRGVNVDGPVEDGFDDIGGIAALIPNHADNAFPSDHQLVEAVLKTR